MTDADSQRTGRAWLPVLVAAVAGAAGALLAVAMAFGAIAARPVDVYTAGELSEEYVDPPPGVHTVVLVGDIMPWDRTSDYLRSYGAEYPYRATAPLLRTADLTVGNFEAPVSEGAERRLKRYAYRVPPWTLSGLVWAGFDGLSLANNHVMDCGPEGLVETLDHFDAVGIGTFGAGRTLTEALEPAVVELGGQTVALCGLLAMEEELPDGSLPDAAQGQRQVDGLGPGYEATEKSPGTALATGDQVRRVVAEARRRADRVILFIHFGVRYRRGPTALQRAIARRAIDAGADLVVGHHAHLWQPVELYRDRPILYGLGNFAFGSGNRNADEGLLARAHLGTAGFETIELFPLRTENRDPRVRYESKVMRGRSATRTLRRLRKLSTAPLEIERGRAVLRLSAP